MFMGQHHAESAFPIGDGWVPFYETRKGPDGECEAVLTDFVQHPFVGNVFLSGDVYRNTPKEVLKGELGVLMDNVLEACAKFSDVCLKAAKGANAS